MANARLRREILLDRRTLAARRGAAVRTGVHLLRVGPVACAAKAERARLSVMVNVRLLAHHFAEHELLRTEPDAIAIGELGELFQGIAVDAAAVAAAKLPSSRGRR